MTTTEESPLAGYFTMEPLLGGSSDPFGVDAWDANLSPEEYGDQSAHWGDNDDNSWSSSDEEDDDCSSQGSCDDEEWNVVYAASFTVVASTTNSPRRTSCAMDANAKFPPMPQPAQLERRDSKVRFCDQPPKVVSYECCSRENYSQLYYSVHELQKIIDEVRLESEKKTSPSVATHHSSTSVTAPTPTRAA